MFAPLHRGGSGPPLLLVHGFTDTWRTWELVLPGLERRHEVLAPTLPGHAGGPPRAESYVDALERILDEAGLETAHVAGNSLGGYLALRLAARGRARTVVALAPAGGRAGAAAAGAAALSEHFLATHELARAAAPHADEIAASEEGRRRATRFTSVRFEHIPPELVAHRIRAAAACAVPELLERGGSGWPLAAERVTCPLRIVWGREDAILPFPVAAVRYRTCFPAADWVVLDGVGHCPQLDVPERCTELILGVTSRTGRSFADD